MTWLVAFLAALPYADRLADKIGAHRAAQRKHEAARARAGGKT